MVLHLLGPLELAQPIGEVEEAHPHEGPNEEETEEKAEREQDHTVVAQTLHLDQLAGWESLSLGKPREFRLLRLKFSVGVSWRKGGLSQGMQPFLSCDKDFPGSCWSNFPGPGSLKKITTKENSPCNALPQQSEGSIGLEAETHTATKIKEDFF